MYKAFFTRFFDIILSFFAIVLLLWLFIFISLAIVIDDRGRFYSNKTSGKDKKAV